MAFRQRFHPDLQTERRDAEGHLGPDEALAGILAVVDWLVRLQPDTDHPFQMPGPQGCSAVPAASNDDHVLYVLYALLPDYTPPTVVFLHYALIKREDPRYVPPIPPAAWDLALTRLRNPDW